MARKPKPKLCKGSGLDKPGARQLEMISCRVCRYPVVCLDEGKVPQHVSGIPEPWQPPLFPEEQHA